MIKDKSNSGQMTVEMILIMVILVSLTLFVSNKFKEDELLAAVVSKPWLVLAGMLQNGVWQPVEQSNAMHPNNFVRHASLKCEDL